MKAYSVPTDFHLSLWAKESNENWPNARSENRNIAGLKGKPIAMNWDERGRLWVCETVDYPNELQATPGPGRDRIKICEDTDNDGHADKFTIFARASEHSINAGLLSRRSDRARRCQDDLLERYRWRRRGRFSPRADYWLGDG